MVVWMAKTFIDLQENVSNKNIKTFNFALGSKTREEMMMISKDSKLSTLLLGNSYLANKEEIEKAISSVKNQAKT